MIVDGLAGAYRQESVWCYSKRAGLIDEYPVTHEQYLGVGPGALSYLGGNLCINAFLIPEYVHAVNDRGSSLASIRRFSPAEQLRFDLLLKLLGGTRIYVLCGKSTAVSGGFSGRKSPSFLLPGPPPSATAALRSPARAVLLAHCDADPAFHVGRVPGQSGRNDWFRQTDQCGYFAVIDGSFVGLPPCGTAASKSLHAGHKAVIVWPQLKQNTRSRRFVSARGCC